MQQFLLTMHYTGTQSALIDYVATRDVDLVKPLGNKTTGKWYISFFVYIPTGKIWLFQHFSSITTARQQIGVWNAISMLGCVDN